MIWFVDEKDWLGRQVKKKVYKKIKKNGKTTEILDPNFFGGGMYTLHKPPEKLSYKMEYAEIYPTSGKKLKPFDTIVTDRTRTIELWKEPKSEQVRIILGSAKGDIKFFTRCRIYFSIFHFIRKLVSGGLCNVYMPPPKKLGSNISMVLPFFLIFLYTFFFTCLPSQSFSSTNQIT